MPPSPLRSPPPAWVRTTCGSIRGPSAQNNLVGLRPTKGLLQHLGDHSAVAHTDVGGPLARTVADLAIVLDATIGPDPDDAATRILDDYELAGFTDSLDVGSLRGARIGKLAALFEGNSAQSRVIEVIDAGARAHEDRGCRDRRDHDPRIA